MESINAGKAPCSCMAYTWALKGSLHHVFWGSVSIPCNYMELHGALGFRARICSMSMYPHAIYVWHSYQYDCQEAKRLTGDGIPPEDGLHADMSYHKH